MSQTCPSCRGTDFEEIDDEKYCATPGCGIRIGGQKTVLENAFEGTEIRLTQEVKSASAKPTARKDTGSRWTTYDAFNLILLRQVDFLVKECGAPDRLRQVVLALWATFLSKSEVAFVDDCEDVSRLPFTSRQRDIALMAKGIENVPDFKAVKHPVQVRRSERLRLGDKIVVRVEPGDESQSEYSSDETEIMDFESIDTSITLSNSSDQITTATAGLQIQCDDADARNEKTGEAEKGVIPHVGVDGEASTSKADDETEGKRKRRKSVRRPVKAEKPLPFELEEHEMNSHGQETCKPLVGKKRSRYRHHPEYIDYMDLRTTLAFIYIAARFINFDIHVTDLIHWVDQGFLVYFASTHLFPDDWFLKARDHQTFCPNSSPFPQAILNRSSKLVHYLEVPLITPVDVFKLIERFLDEMNLPISILHLIRSQSGVSEVVCKLGEYRMGKKMIFRFYELQAVAIILITLRKMFGADQAIKSVCDEIRKLPGCANYFCFDEWIEAAKLRILALRHYYLPLFGNCESDITDPRVVIDFHAQVVRNWRFLANGVSREDPAADDDLARLFGRLGSGKDPKIEFPGPSTRFLNEASEFVKSRMDKKPFLKHVLSLNFRTKALDYVTPQSLFSNVPYDLLTPRGCTKWDTIIENLPIEVTVLLQLSSWLLHMSPLQLLPEIKKVEKIVFPEHYPVTRARKKRGSGAKSMKKRRHADQR